MPRAVKLNRYGAYDDFDVVALLKLRNSTEPLPCLNKDESTRLFSLINNTCMAGCYDSHVYGGVQCAKEFALRHLSVEVLVSLVASLSALAVVVLGKRAGAWSGRSIHIPTRNRAGETMLLLDLESPLLLGKTRRARARRRPPAFLPAAGTRGRACLSRHCLPTRVNGNLDPERIGVRNIIRAVPAFGAGVPPRPAPPWCPRALGALLLDRHLVRLEGRRPLVEHLLELFVADDLWPSFLAGTGVERLFRIRGRGRVVLDEMVFRLPLLCLGGVGALALARKAWSRPRAHDDSLDIGLAS